MTMPIIVVI